MDRRLRTPDPYGTGVLRLRRGRAGAPPQFPRLRTFSRQCPLLARNADSGGGLGEKYHEPTGLWRRPNRLEPRMACEHHGAPALRQGGRGASSRSPDPLRLCKTGGKIAGHCFKHMGRSCNPRKMAYLSYVVKRFLALVVCFLACSVLGFADLPRLSPSCCAGADSCHCNDPATVNPCTCSNHTDSDFPKWRPLPACHFQACLLLRNFRLKKPRRSRICSRAGIPRVRGLRRLRKSAPACRFGFCDLWETSQHRLVQSLLFSQLT